MTAQHAYRLIRNACALALASVFAGACARSSSGAASTVSSHGATSSNATRVVNDNVHWVGTWTTAPQLVEQRNLPPAPGLTGNTLRQVVHVSIGGQRIRVRFANLFGNAPVEINSARVAASAGAGAVRNETSKAVSFHGKARVTLGIGEVVVSDPLEFEVASLSDIAISIYYGNTSTDITGHPGSRTTSYLMPGDHIADAAMPTAVHTEHWYTINGIDVLADNAATSLAIIGNSITDGRGSGTDKNNRWPDELARRLGANAKTTHVAVLNSGIGGNCVVRGGLGPPAVDRFDRDVIQQAGARWMIVFEGVNDIGGARDSAASLQIARDLIAAFQQFISKAHDHNIRAYGATILPFAGSQYDRVDHEVARKTVNQWIRTSGAFDGVIDFDLALRDPANPTKLLPTADSGDHLHPSELGHHMLAESIKLSLFER